MGVTGAWKGSHRAQAAMMAAGLFSVQYGRACFLARWRRERLERIIGGANDGHNDAVHLVGPMGVPRGAKDGLFDHDGEWQYHKGSLRRLALHVSFKIAEEGEASTTG